MSLDALRRDLASLHLELPRNGLVTWTSGNISARDPETGLVVIKPSGIKFEDLTPENMVVVDLDGNIVEADHKASSDTASHCYIYRQRPDINGVVHTHSRYATAFAALGREIPCVLTAMAVPMTNSAHAVVGSILVCRVADSSGKGTPFGASEMDVARRLADYAAAAAVKFPGHPDDDGKDEAEEE